MKHLPIFMSKFVTSVILKQYDDSQSDNKPKQESDEKNLYNPYPPNSRYGQLFMNSRSNNAQYNDGPAH